ncbi:glycoside hydrolase family 30 [Bacillus sp. 3255]|uniref:glycoside hydrolase family 30 n=1 Tax=Bacillus sp. 3255 TaxID=2817904 RepID=UPI0028597525|nr:glycoside hydrolase family 30 [Bacillus sp. 3255]MDR6884970.1 O-glycosyl hydrolase [Bacillus sp. 3255]
MRLNKLRLSGRSISLLAVVWFVASYTLNLPVAAAAETIVLTKSTTYQTIDGFGAAANKPVYDLQTGMSTAVQNEILDKLFLNSGSNAGLTVVRWEINPFKPSEDSSGVEISYCGWNGCTEDWTTDAHQRWFADQALARYSPMQFYAVPWSPPSWMKDTGTVKGGHLLAARYTDYANYLARWVQKYRNDFGYNIKWLSIQNEADYENAQWATARYFNAEMDSFVGYLDTALTAKGVRPQVKLTAPEATSENVAMNFLNNMPANESKLDYIAYHNYGNNNAALYEETKPKLMTEYNFKDESNNLWNPGDAAYDNQQAVDLAANIHRALTAGGMNGARGYLYWWSVGKDESLAQQLINLNTSSGTYATSKVLYAMGNFSRVMRPGYVRIGAVSSHPSLLAVATKINSTGKAQLVVVNTSSSDITATVSGFGTSSAAASKLKTSATDNLNNMADVALSGGSFTATFSAKSIYSFSEK